MREIILAIKLLIKWAKENKVAFTKTLKKDLWMVIHPNVRKFAEKVKNFGYTVFSSEDEQIVDIIDDICARFPTEEEATAEILVRYIEYQAKKGSIEAAKYIRFANRHLGGLRSYCVEGTRMLENLDDLIDEV